MGELFIVCFQWLVNLICSGSLMGELFIVCFQWLVNLICSGSLMGELFIVCYLVCFDTLYISALSDLGDICQIR